LFREIANQTLARDSCQYIIHRIS